MLVKVSPPGAKVQATRECPVAPMLQDPCLQRLGKRLGQGPKTEHRGDSNEQRSPPPAPPRPSQLAADVGYLYLHPHS